jgi:hypothetical protein
METELTKKMKKGLRYFKPEMPTTMRTIRFAEEVWTPTGIVDVIRFEDYKERDDSFCGMIDYKSFPKQEQEIMRTAHPKKMLGECKVDGKTYPNKNCKGCFWHKHSYVVGMLITCYECKITLSDFKSHNGHNFHGNKNYYVVPKSLVNDIKDLVPQDIGIIAYYPDTNNYRIVKECEQKKIDETLKVRLLYDALKKWVDKFHSEY